LVEKKHTFYLYDGLNFFFFDNFFSMGRLVENQASARTSGGYGRSQKLKLTN
jgi:hypothetical protein